MKSLLSINFKFMVLNPKELIDLVLNTKSVKGVEACVDYDKEEEMHYLDQIVDELKNNDLILQIHGDSSLDIDKQIEFVHKLESYSDYLGYPIVLTLHTIYDEDKEESINKSILYIEKLIQNIDLNKIVISVENLNASRQWDRLNKEEIRTTVLNNESLFFTYDIGHTMSDYGNITNLDEYMIEEIRNIHIHTHNDTKDHQPIYKKDKYWNEIIKAILFLKRNNYRYNIVFEYDLYDCRGEDIKEKVIDYLESIDYVSERY